MRICRIAKALESASDLELQYNYAQILFRLTPRRAGDFLTRIFGPNKKSLAMAFSSINSKTFIRVSNTNVFAHLFIVYIFIGCERDPTWSESK